MNKIFLLVFLLPVIAMAQSPDVKTGNGNEILVSGLAVTSDSGTLDITGCAYIPGNVQDYLNCLATTNSIAAGETYQLELSKNEQYLNGVSTLDLVMIHRHLLKINSFEDASQTIAADVNGDNKVNLRDLIELRRLILGVTVELEVPSWSFYKSNDLTTGGIGSETDLNYASEDFPLSNLSIIGVKKGDVNYSAR